MTRPEPEAPTTPTGTVGADRYRLETELRRLRTELELRDEAARQLNRRLRDAEREAAAAAGPVVEALTAQLSAWQDRALAAEAELATLRRTVLYRVAAPLLALYRVRARLPELARSAVGRLNAR